ncbi:unnamed protein product [Rotaria socialis]|uniref:Cilia- and flagella-associated protein 157 n=1 Tax=Rotaria socialis TaxID=392032 RepID=A0A820W033_9BILA|nr:unnamed protein product [Rotaria socialis]CAF3463962.1 unnamed protein product [Rotaria socialis]CAF4097128.1 unnamed protein product [Rotaria socialis]CAF4107361.1 unnamed protein product [Rotaria socialis]CAF4235872.1 unnamed protein product [Rotaria socialis]
MCRSYGDQFESLFKDKRDISSYLKKQLDLRNEQVFDLNDRLTDLQQAKDYEKDLFEKKIQNLKEQYDLEIQNLGNENMLLKTRLVALEEFEYQRQTMEKTIDELKSLILKKEDAYKKALYHMEIALMFFKDRLKKEAIEYLNDLAIEFHHNAKNQLSNTIKRALHENFYLNNQFDYLSNQLEKTIEINKNYTADNQRLTRTIAIFEDVETHSAKKHIVTENEKLDKCKQQQNSVHEILVPIEKIEKESTKLSRNREDNSKQEKESTEIRNLEEENNLLKDIIDQAAISIADVVQSRDDDTETASKVEKHNEMLEQLLSILLTSHHLGRTGLPLQKKSFGQKGIFPGSRLGLHRIHQNSSVKASTHYCRGDLGLVRHDN